MIEVSAVDRISVLELLPEFQRWKVANPESSLANYVRSSITAENFFAVTEIVLPSLIQHKNCVFLKDSFKESVFNQLFEIVNGDLTKIERVMNHRHVRDIAAFLEHSSWMMVETVGTLLKTGLEKQLHKLSNDAAARVEMIRTDYDIEITFYLDR